MPGRVVLLSLLAFALGSGPSLADDDQADAVLLAFEKKVERAVKEAGPSIARIYVSRSTAYEKAPFWGVDTVTNSAGDLGRFDAEAARKRVPAEARNRARILRTIAEHDLSDPKIVPESYGSGLVVDGKGLVLTCAHVVRNATRIFVRLPGKEGSWADIHASDPRSDLAVLRLLDPPAGLKALALGRGGLVRKGQFVVGMANTFAPRFRGNDDPTASTGIITALRKEVPSKKSEPEHLPKKTLHHYGTLLQVDARTTPGCSGGVLLDLEGKAVGLTTALAGITGEQPAGFAIPFEVNIRGIIDVLKRGEEVEYGFLGVVMSSQGDFGGQRSEVRLQEVMPGSPAARAGLRGNDALVSINGKRVTSNSDLFLFIGMALAGRTIRVEASRGGIVRTYEVKLAKYYVPGPVVAAKRPAARFGLRVDHRSVLVQRNLIVRRWPPEGVAIREVVPGSPADKGRLQPDKIITHVNGTLVMTPAEYYQEITRAGKKVELTYLMSDGRPERLTLEEK